MEQIIKELKKMLEELHWHNILTLHEGSLEFILSEMDFTLSCAEEENLEEMPKYYAERLRVFHQLAKKLCKKYKINIEVK